MKRVFFSLFVICFIFAVAICEAAEPKKIVNVTVPDISIETDAAGLSNVTIPNGKLTEEEGKPEVPYYITKVIYPQGYKITKVTLDERTDVQEMPKIELPIVGDEKTPKQKVGIYPKKDFDWKEIKNPDGSSTLELEMYPFMYDIAPQTARFYKTYKFTVDYSKSPIEIEKVMPSKPKYYPKDKIHVTVDVDNPGGQQDVNVNVSLVNTETNKQVAEFSNPNPEKLEKNKKKVITVEGPIENVPDGDYKLVVNVLDTEGKIVDTEIGYITIYYPKVELTELEVAPKKFSLGDRIIFTLNAKNTGNIEIEAAKAIFRVMLDKDIIDETAEIFPPTKAGATVTVSSYWNSSVAKTGSLYHVKAFVLFDQWQSNELDEVFSTNAMPTAKFTYSPSDLKAGAEIKFDATTSRDDDGKIVKYTWDFGDNSESPTTAQVNHKYYTYGVYNVVLTVTDNEGGTSSYTKILTIKKPQTQVQTQQPE